MAKTYLPGVYKEMNDLKRYTTKWAAQLGVSMSPPQAVALAKVITCLLEALPLFIPPPPTE
jgi:hypothetical protein